VTRDDPKSGPGDIRILKISRDLDAKHIDGAPLAEGISTLNKLAGTREREREREREVRARRLIIATGIVSPRYI